MSGADASRREVTGLQAELAAAKRELAEARAAVADSKAQLEAAAPRMAVEEELAMLHKELSVAVSKVATAVQVGSLKLKQMLCAGASSSSRLRAMSGFHVPTCHVEECELHRRGSP